MTASVVLLCPGQGAQRVGMGRAWAEASPEAAAVFRRADAALGDRLGAPLSRLCFEGPEERLSRTDATQPALFVAAVASWAALTAGDLRGAEVAAAAGLSLGEYTALHLAGSLSFEDALSLVALRGAAMQAAAERSRGGMVALIGASEAQAREVCEEAAGDGSGARGVLTPANLNAPGQIVISGDASACDRAVPVAERMGLRATRLVVAGAFHSPLMAPAAERLARALEGVEIRAPGRPVVSNVTGQPHAADVVSIRSRLVEQLTAPVRWDDSCRWLLGNVPASGAGAPGGLHELAPGKVLAGLMRRIEKSAKVTTHDEPGT